MEPHARTFEGIRPEVLDRLVDVRGSIDHTLSGVPSQVIRQEFDAVLNRMQSYLAEPDLDRYRRWARRYVAVRLGEGFAPETLIHSWVALGDVVVEVARQRLPSGSDTDAFVRDVVRLTFVAARLIVEVLAAELDELRRSARRGR